MSATKEDPKYRAGAIVVLRGLRRYAQQPTSSPAGAKVAELVKLLPRGMAYVRLWQGMTFRQGAKFSKKGRVIDRCHISRLATDRERVLGMPILFETTRAA